MEGRPQENEGGVTRGKSRVSMYYQYTFAPQALPSFPWGCPVRLELKGKFVVLGNKTVDGRGCSAS
jgi:hypothetical protein